jgi:hypothetical protein
MTDEGMMQEIIVDDMVREHNAGGERDPTPNLIDSFSLERANVIVCTTTDAPRITHMRVVFFTAVVNQTFFDATVDQLIEHFQAKYTAADALAAIPVLLSRHYPEVVFGFGNGDQGLANLDAFKRIMGTSPLLQTTNVALGTTAPPESNTE